MNKEKYQNIVNKNTPKKKKLKNIVIAFLIGGILGLIGEGLSQLYMNAFGLEEKNATTMMIITLIVVGGLFTALGFFDKWVSFAKAGILVPITGFAHAMVSSSMEYRKEGIITGIGANMFKLAGPVIVLGIVSAYFFGLIRLLVMGG